MSASDPAPNTSSRMTFPQALHRSYRRVNKAGSFNTRCFPNHCAAGHIDSAFCGRPFVVIAEGFPEGTVFFAEFTVLGSPAKREPSQFSPDGFLGEARSNSVVVFNKALAAWKYSWRSSRHSYDTEHVMRVYAFSSHNNLVLGYFDSSSFAVSCTRSAPLECTPSDLLLILSAMNKLVPASHALPSSMEIEFDSLIDFNLDAPINEDEFSFEVMDSEMASPSSLSLNPADEARFMAHEQLRSVLQRLYLFMLTNYRAWRTPADMTLDVERFLGENECTNIETLARTCAQVVNVSLRDHCQTREHMTTSEAMSLAHGFLEPGEHFCKTIDVGGYNDLSGTYIRNREFVSLVSEQKTSFGWSPVDIDIEAQVSKVTLSVLSPTLFFAAFLGGNGRADMFVLNEPNQLADARPTAFGQGVKRTVHMFATSTGYIQVLQTSELVVLTKQARCGNDAAAHVQFRSLRSQTILKDERFVFERVA